MVDRARDRRDRLGARPRSARRAQAQSLRPTAATSRPTACASRTTSCAAMIDALRGDQRLSRAAARDRGVQRRRARSLKRGIALTPVKFGISLHHHPSQPGRRAGARLPGRLDPPEPRRHRDGAGALHQGRAGGGRGIRRRRSTSVKITATTTAKVPNTSATAASSGSDLNGMAAQIAARRDQGAAGRLRRRELTASRRDQIEFRDNRVFIGNRVDAVRRARQAGLSRRACRCPRPASTRRRRSTGIAPRRTGPAVLLFRLRRGLLGSAGRRQRPAHCRRRRTPLPAASA